MSRKYFGTDGVRGRVGEHPLTVEFALEAGELGGARAGAEAAARCWSARTRASRVTCSRPRWKRASSRSGVNVMLIGPLPTPGIAYLTKRFECDFGVVISASHNPYEDNGIKFFDRNGGKLNDEIEAQIETVSRRAAGDAQLERAGQARRASTSRACAIRNSR